MIKKISYFILKIKLENVPVISIMEKRMMSRLV